MTRAEFILKLKGYYRKKSKEWEHTRQICYTVASSAFGRKKRLPNIKSWWPLPTDPKINISQDKMKSNWESLKKNE